MRGDAVEPWIVELFRTIDAKDAQGFAAAFTDDGVFRFANQPPVQGRAQVEQAVAGFYSMIQALRHEIVGVCTGTWPQGAVVSIETSVVYTRPDGSQTPPLQAVSVARLRGKQIADYRIFVDAAPLFAPAA